MNYLMQLTIIYKEKAMRKL